MGSWKKLLYSNAGLNSSTTENSEEPQGGVTPEDLSSIYISTDNNGAYQADGQFTNIPSAPLVLKRVTGGEGTPATYDGATLVHSADDTPAGTLVWGKGAEEHTVLGEDTLGNAQAFTKYTVPVASSNGYTLMDSTLVYSGSDTDEGSLDATLLSTSSIPFTTGTGSITGNNLVISEGNDEDAINVNSGKFVVKGTDGDTSIAGTLGVSLSSTLSGAVTIGTDSAGVASQAYGSLTISSASGGTTAGNLVVAGGASANTLTSTGSTTVGDGLTVTGGTSALGGNLTVASTAAINGATTSTDSASGALTVVGGVGIAENLNVGGNLNIGGATTLGDNSGDSTTISGTLTHNGGVATLGNGAMTITSGATPTNITAKPSGGGSGAISGVTENGNITINMNNASGSAIDYATSLTAGDQWWVISTAGEIVALEVATSETADIADGAADDVVFTVNSWVDGGNDTISNSAQMYESVPTIATVTMTTGAQFQGDTVIVDSTNTALTDSTVHINKASGSTDYGSTDNPTLVFGRDGNSAAVCRLQFQNAHSVMALTHAVNADPDSSNEDNATVSTLGMHSMHVKGLVLDKPASDGNVSQNGPSNAMAGTPGDDNSMIAVNSSGVPFIWIP